MTAAARAVHAMKYGALHVGPARSGEGRTVWRDDVYHPADGRRPILEPALAAGASDVSPRHNAMTYGEGAAYDSHCSCCFLGSTHTQALHAREVSPSDRTGEQTEFDGYGRCDEHPEET